MPPSADYPRADTIAILGAGITGLVTAHTLLQDGFAHVDILTRDNDIGGVWSQDRIYPGLYLNNVHGEYRVSSMDMPKPISDGVTDTRLTGDDLSKYVKAFAMKYLEGKVQFGMEVRHIRRQSSGEGWQVELFNHSTSDRETREYARIILCTGGCSAPHIPSELSPAAAAKAGFQGMVFHSMDFGVKMSDLLASVPAEAPDADSSPVIVVGGGKSSQDICAYLANEGRKVTMICPDLDAFTAGPKPLPDFVRKSRLLSLFSPHIHLRTYLERFLHTTRLGKKVVDFMWHGMVDSSIQAMGIPDDSVLRNTVSPYWHIRVNDEGVPRPNGFHALALAEKIQVISPARVVQFGEDGRSVLLTDGRSISASAVILGTGYASTWSAIFDEETAIELSLSPQPAEPTSSYQWNYTTLSESPPLHPDARRWSSTMYRGIVPARSIAHRDFAVNGAVVSPNFGYTAEVASHWISSYFLGDDMRIPSTPEEALRATARDAAWLKLRYPQIPTALHGSHTSYLAFWSWPQHVDDLLEDMGLPVMRSGGNALTWPFKIVDLSEIKDLKEERDARRANTERV